MTQTKKKLPPMRLVRRARIALGDLYILGILSETEYQQGLTRWIRWQGTSKR